MVRRLALIAAILFPLSAFAASDTTTINFTVVLPSAAPATSGTVKATLSAAGEAPDGAGTAIVISSVTATIAANGAVSIALVPNDIITPSDTFYTFHYDVRSPTSASWNEKRRVVTSPDPTPLSGAPLVESPPGTSAPIAQIQDEGTAVAKRTKLNMTGAGVTCTDDAANSRTTCDIPSSGGGGTPGGSSEDVQVNVGGAFDNVTGLTADTITGQLGANSLAIPNSFATSGAGIYFVGPLGPVSWMTNVSSANANYAGIGTTAAVEALNIFLGLNAGPATMPDAPAPQDSATNLHAGKDNIGIGSHAMDNLTIGASNTAMGRQSMELITTGRYNVGIGTGALQGFGTPFIGESNTAVGQASGNSVSDAFYNILMGDGSGISITTGDKNVILGTFSDVSTANAQNQIAIGYDIIARGDNTATIGNTNAEAGGTGTTDTEVRGTFTIKDPSDTNKATITAAPLSASRTYNAPDAAGTLAVTASSTGVPDALACATCVDVSQETNLAVTAPATLVNDTIGVQDASISQGGVVTTGSQTFNGAKTFNTGAIAAAGQAFAVTSGCSIDVDVDCPRNATGGGGITFKEGADDFGDGVADDMIFQAPSTGFNNGVSPCTLQADGRLPDDCVGDGLDGGGVNAFDDLTDVTITTPATNNIVAYNGSAWVNTASAKVTETSLLRDDFLVYKDTTDGYINMHAPTTGTNGCAGSADKLIYNTTTHALTCGVDGGGAGFVVDVGWAAKGDLAVATANDAATVLPVGANTYTIEADSTQASGIKWSPTAKVTETSPADAHMLLYDSALSPASYANKAMSGDATITKAGVLAIGASKITSSMILNDAVGSDDIDYSTLESTETLGAGEAYFSSGCGGGLGGVVFEGTTANTIQGCLTWNPTAADRTFLLPAAGGSAAALERTQSFTAVNTYTVEPVMQVGAAVGLGTDADSAVLRVDRASTDPTLTWSESNGWFRFASSKLALDPVTDGTASGIYFPITAPGTTKNFMGMTGTGFGTSPITLDNVLCFAYNSDCSGAKVNTAMASSAVTMEGDFDDDTNHYAEWNWNASNATSGAGKSNFRPMGMQVNWGSDGAQLGTANINFQAGSCLDSAKSPVNTGTCPAGVGDNYSFAFRYPSAWVNFKASLDGGSVANDTSLNVYARTADFSNAAAAYGIQNKMFLDHTDARAFDFVGQRNTVDFSATGNSSTVTALVGVENIVKISGVSGTGKAASTAYGERITLQNAGTTNDSPVSNWYGISVQTLFGATDQGVQGTYAGLYFAPPTQPGSGTSFSNWFPIRIDDQNFTATGKTSGDVVRIEPQTSSAGQGNVNLAGGAYNNGHLRITDDHFWVGGGAFRFKHGGAPGSATDGVSAMEVSSPTANPVVAKCGSVSVDPPSIGLTQTGVATASVTGLAANDVCTCAARTNFDDDLIPTQCYGSSNQLNLRLYNPTVGTIDAGAQTVDYCCFAK